MSTISSDAPFAARASFQAPLGRGLLSVVGNTPVIRLEKLFPNARFFLYAKLECMNPGGSVKDRTALRILLDAMESGEITPSTTIVESSSGNLAIGLAQACAYLGLRFIAVLDSKTTAQNISIIKAYGAEVVVVTEPRKGSLLEARLERVDHLLATIPDSYWSNQYANPSNSAAHYGTTMAELDQQLGGKIDWLFCACSTCGTLRGCAEYVREHRLNTIVVAVDAVGSVIFGTPPGCRLIPGHGAARVPALFERGLANACVHVTDLECVVGCRRLVRSEGLLAGGSSGGVIQAIQHALPSIPDGAVCAAILADRGERYLDTIYNDEWVESHFGNLSHFWETPADGIARNKARPPAVRASVAPASI